MSEQTVRCSNRTCNAETLWRRWGLDGWINVTITRPGQHHGRTEGQREAKVEQRFYCSESCAATTLAR